MEYLYNKHTLIFENNEIIDFQTCNMHELIPESGLTKLFE